MTFFDTFFLRSPLDCFVAYSAILTSHRTDDNRLALHLVDGGQLFIDPRVKEASLGLVALGKIGLNPLFVPQRTPTKCWNNSGTPGQGRLNLVDPSHKTGVSLTPPDGIERTFQICGSVEDISNSFSSFFSASPALLGYRDLQSHSEQKKGAPTYIPPSFVVAVQPENPSLFVPFNLLSHVTPLSRGFGLALTDGSLLRLKEFPAHLGMVSLKGRNGTQIGINPLLKTEIVSCPSGIQTEIWIDGSTRTCLRVDEPAQEVRRKTQQASRRTCELHGFDLSDCNHLETPLPLHPGLRGAMVPSYSR